MTDDLETYLKDFFLDIRMPQHARALAERLHEQLVAGIIPSMSKVKKLSKYRLDPPQCGRLLFNGSCRWLRKNYRVGGIRQPRPGEVVFCRRKAVGPAGNLYIECPGYTTVKED